MNKKLFFSLIAIILLLSACDWLKPDYEEPYQKYYAATTLINDDSGENIFITDDGIKLFPSNTISIPDKQKDSLLNQRYYIGFQIADGYKNTDNPMVINLISMQTMYNYQITEIESDSSLSAYKNQPLTIERLWYTNKYINFISYVMGSGSTNHNYHLIYNKNNSSDTIFLTLRYDNNKDVSVYTLSNAVSYDISKYTQNNQNDSTTICFNYNSGNPLHDTLYFKIKNTKQ